MGTLNMQSGRGLLLALRLTRP